MIQHYAYGALLILAGFTLADQPALRRFTFQEPHMGTLFRLILYATDEATAQKASGEAFLRIAALDATMSDYKSASELMQLCQKAGGPAVPVSVDLFAVLREAQRISRLSEGAFDVTVGPVVRLWRKARRTKEMPSAEEIKKAVALVGYENLRLDSTRQSVQLLVAGMLLDLGGIAKGFAAEAAMEMLRKHGITRALVAASGDIVVSDPPPDAPGWKVGIAPLKNPETPPTRFLLLKNASVSTSGDGEQFVEIAGKRYSHVVDPKTGLGLNGRRSVTVVAPNGTLADALATSACVLGPVRGLQFMAHQNGCEALFAWETDQGNEREVETKGFDRYVWKENN